ncbi:MAG: shikimate kinase [Clostridiaceae bacterium]|jgi:shikimate kinase|nr:shikimate kinase [Clostridiaceae bacterium]
MKTNIVLIGLMGVGKTTIGKGLSALLNMPFTDSDENIEKNYGKISDLFAISEEHFRDLESKIIKSMATLDGVIMSTGGGVVLRTSNMDELKNKGVIFYLTRPVDEILKTVETDIRPLLKNNPDALYELAEKREPLYKKYCDYVIDASDINNAIKTIKSIWTKIS